MSLRRFYREIITALMHQITEVQERADQFTHPFTIYGLFILSAIYMFYNLWGGSLHAWDSAWHAEIAREIVVEGKGWLTLHYNHELFFGKPPLFIWMIAVAYKIFGVNEFAVRIWSTLFGFGSVIMVYILAKELFSSKRIALFSSLILVGFHHFVRLNRMAQIDAPLTFFILLGIYLFWIGRKREIYFLFVGIVTGIAFMLKNFAAFQIPLIIMFYVFLAGEKKNLVNPKFIYGFLIGFLICLPWHIYEYSKYGQSFIDEYFFLYILTRTLGRIPEHRGGSVFYYFQAIFSKNFPLGAIGLLIIPYTLFSIFYLKENNTKKPAFLLIIIAPIVTLTLFTFVSYKNASYMLPAYPFLSILIATSADLIVGKVRHRNNRIIAIILIILIAIPTANFLLNNRLRNPDYNHELKEISLAVKYNSSKSDQIFLYKIYPVPVVLFYSERKVFRGSEDIAEYGGDYKPFLIKGTALLKMASERGPFICIMLKKDDSFYKQLQNKKYGLTVLKENDWYILFKRESSTDS